MKRLLITALLALSACSVSDRGYTGRSTPDLGRQATLIQVCERLNAYHLREGLVWVQENRPDVVDLPRIHREGTNEYKRECAINPEYLLPPKLVPELNRSWK